MKNPVFAPSLRYFSRGADGQELDKMTHYFSPFLTLIC